MWRGFVITALLGPLGLAGCGLLPAAPGSGADSAPPDYVNVLETDNVRVQLVPRGAEGAALNDHPAAFTPEQLQTLLMTLRIESEGEGAVTLASPGRLQRVAGGMAKALARATPRQDLSVLFFRNKTTGVLFKTSRYVTVMRAFYRDNRLNLIFGELDNFYSGHRKEQNNPALPGDRTKALDVNGTRLLTTNAWQWHEGRRDWVEMPATPEAIAGAGDDLPAVSAFGTGESARELEHGPAATLANPSPAFKPGKRADPVSPKVQTEQPAAKPPPEPATPSPAPAAVTEPVAAPQDTGSGSDEATWAKIEQRLQTLKGLRERGLITQDDYQRKKDELLETLP